MHVTGVECVNCMCDWEKGFPGTRVCAVGGKAAVVCV